VVLADWRYKKYEDALSEYLDFARLRLMPL
jgi:hypothetical protein